MLLKNRVAIVTGGTRGIGRAIVKKFVKEGCRVAFTFKDNKSLATRLKKQTNGRATGYQVDIRDLTKVKEFIARLRRRFKRLDILVNNAGIAQDKALVMMVKQDWDDIIDINLNGVFNITRSCILTFMKQKSGNIINISSLSGIRGVPGQTNYAASKAGIIGFTKALAKEVGPFNIRVNAIAPGFIETDMTDHLVKDALRKKVIEETPLRRFGLPDEIAELALFLATKKSSFITGQTLIIDGGIAS